MLGYVSEQAASFSQVVPMRTTQLPKEQAGALLRARREALGLTQEQVAEQVGIPTITQLSEYENGKVNVARSKYLPKLATVLGLAEEDIVAINPTAVFAVAAAQAMEEKRSLYFLFPELRPRGLRPIPPELQVMIEDKAALAPELGEKRWQQYLAGQRFAAGPASAEQWWNLYLVVKNAGIEPSENQGWTIYQPKQRSRRKK